MLLKVASWITLSSCYMNKVTPLERCVNDIEQLKETSQRNPAAVALSFCDLG